MGQAAESPRRPRRRSEMHAERQQQTLLAHFIDETCALVVDVQMLVCRISGEPVVEVVGASAIDLPGPIAIDPEATDITIAVGKKAGSDRYDDASGDDGIGPGIGCIGTH